MFSCRVQSKRVEHAFLSFLLKRFVAEKGGDFFANYLKTSKNAVQGKVFQEMGFQVLQEENSVVAVTNALSFAARSSTTSQIQTAG